MQVRANGLPDGKIGLNGFAVCETQMRAGACIYKSYLSIFYTIFESLSKGGMRAESSE